MNGKQQLSSIGETTTTTNDNTTGLVSGGYENVCV
jgi:hypothetical protein